MDRTGQLRYSALCVLAVCLGSGCAPLPFLDSRHSDSPIPRGASLLPLNPANPDKSKPIITDDKSARGGAAIWPPPMPQALPPPADLPPHGLAWGRSPVPQPDPTNPASGVIRADFAEPGAVPPQVLPQPRPGEPPSATGGAQPGRQPTAANPQAAMPQVPAAVDTSQRPVPTVGGQMLNLGPGESGAERAIELARKLEALAVENRVLLARVKMLEATAEGREHALAESLREVETASGEVARTRNELILLRRDIGALRERLRQVEKEDLDTLRSIISALERLLDPAPPKGPMP